MGFSTLIILLFSTFSIFTYNEVIDLQKSIKDSNNKIAKEEILTALHEANLDIKNHAKDFANWQEVSQQISSPVYYAYWHQHRSLQAGILPQYISDTSIYNLDGEVISKLKTSLPETINTNDLSSDIETDGSKLDLLAYHKVYDRNNKTEIIGYVAIRANLKPELIENRQFNYIDKDSISVSINEKTVFPAKQLIKHLTFNLRPVELMDEIMTMANSLLYRMALIIGIPTLLLYPLVTLLISKPLSKISAHIDLLKNDTANQTPPDFGCVLAVTELEKVSSSLNEYHKKLFEVHTSLDHKNKELWTLAHHDSLTGALNRRAFDNHWTNLQDIFSGGRIEVCLAIFDINNFKAFNDSYGHHIGDDVLVGISQSIMNVLRNGEKLYRLGGDEFACIFIDCNKDAALEIAGRCEKAVCDIAFSENGIKEPVRISIGLAYAGKDRKTDLSSLQWQADIAMYSAKQPGNSHICFYSDDMKQGMKGVFSSHINNIVYEAITDGTGISMHYQPIVSCENLQPAYYEALIRINTNETVIMPNDIFQLVEARRLEIEMDKAIFKQIYIDLETKVIPVGTGVSINVSGKSIINKDVVEQLGTFKHFIGNYKIVLEVTETALITQIKNATENLSYLRSLGFLIALDDFGSGYSSLKYLTEMPVDIVKFDISLTRSLLDHRQKNMVRHLANMISETGHKLVAEGIETEELLTKVKNLDFAYGQGYFLGKPVVNPKIN